MKKGFTLAEVLITLAIIGVVAALTIPVVMVKFQQRELYTRFIQTYNVLSNVYSQLKLDGVTDVVECDSRENVEAMILSKLKYSLQCEANDANCFGSSSPIAYKPNIIGISTSANLYSLPSGAVFQVERMGYEHDYLVPFVAVDTNGIKKGPNAMGRDYFVFFFYPYQVTPGFNLTSYNDFISSLDNREILKPNKENIYYRCNPTNNLYDTCGLRLLLDGKMDY